MSIHHPLDTLYCKLPTSAHPEAEAAFLTIATHRLPPSPTTTFEEDDRARIAGVNFAVEVRDLWELVFNTVMPAIGAADPADLDAKACVELGF
jgi:hypothetical protein